MTYVTQLQVLLALRRTMLGAGIRFLFRPCVFLSTFIWVFHFLPCIAQDFEFLLWADPPAGYSSQDDEPLMNIFRLTNTGQTFRWGKNLVIKNSIASEGYRGKEVKSPVKLKYDATVPIDTHASHLRSDFYDVLYFFVFLTSVSQRKRIYKLSAISLSSNTFSARTVEFMLSWGKISPNLTYMAPCIVIMILIYIQRDTTFSSKNLHSC
jgi:hypothetical protein